MSLVFLVGILTAVLVILAVVRQLSDKESRGWATVAIAADAVAIAAVHLVFSFDSVPSGSVGVVSFFGHVEIHSAVEPGPHFKNPYSQIVPMSVQRREVKRSSANGGKSEEGFVVVQSKDELSLDVDVTVPYALNARYAARLYAAVGDDKVYHSTMVQSAASHAVRDGYVAFNASDAYGPGREKVAEKITEIFQQRLIGQLRPLPAFADLSDDELKQVFLPIPVQLEKTVPPERVRTAIAENKAALLDLERQGTLNKIATEEALRKEQEGAGVTKYLKGLPQDTPVDRAIELLNASANMERAKAFKIGVEQGRLTMVYITDGGGRTPVSVNGEPKK